MASLRNNTEEDKRVVKTVGYTRSPSTATLYRMGSTWHAVSIFVFHDYSTPVNERWDTYALLCEHDKMYVGRTLSPVTDVRKCGAYGEWTRLHRPLHVVYARSSIDVNAVTRYMMAKHGINNVRGGDYQSVVLTLAQLADLSSRMRKKIN